MEKVSRRSAARLLTALMAVSACNLPIDARQLSPDQALARVINASSEGASARRARAVAPSASAMRLVYTGRTSNPETPALYVFGSPKASGGYIVASADSRLRPLLGVSDSGDLTSGEIPENMRWWLNEYEHQIDAYLASAPAEAAASLSSGSVFENYESWTPVEPIVQTLWDQSAPYNNLCPQAPQGGLCVTGCVATAMAQVIKTIGHYDGKGSHSYTSASIGKTVSFDYSAWNCDFSQMKNDYSYGSNPTQAEMDQVANLMLACGVAVNMNYTSSGSSAGDPLPAAIQYFGFDPASRMVKRDGYQSDEWEAIVYNQLKSGRPLYYSGSGIGGHAFVCDGYSDNGLFHINWGWSGQSNGYFVLSALNPTDQGIGSFEGGYNMYQSIGIFVKPGEAAPEIPAPKNQAPCTVVYNSALESPLAWWPENLYKLQNFKYTVLGSNIGYPAKIGIGMLFRDPDGVKPDMFASPSEYVSVSYQETKTDPLFDISTVKFNGGEVWNAYPAYCVEGQEGFWVVEKFGNVNVNDHYRVTVDAKGGLSFTLASVENPDVKVFRYTANDIYSTDYLNHASCLITNFSNQDFCEQMTLRLDREDGSQAMVISNTSSFLRAGESLELATYFSTNGLTPGDYWLRLYRTAYGVPLDDNSLRVTVLPGSRPVASKNDGPQGMCQVALWVNDRYAAIEPVLCKSGDSYAGTTALSPNEPHSLEYYMAFFNHGKVDDAPIKTYFVASRTFDRGAVWGKGDAFSIKPDLPLGIYTMAFVDANGTMLSYPVDFTVVVENEDILYRLSDDGKSLVATACVDGAKIDKVEIPASLAAGGKTYPVSALDDALFDFNRNLEEVTLPESVSSVGVNAFRGTTSLRYVHFNSADVPFLNSALAFYGVNPSVEFYVDSEAHPAYAASFSSPGALYARITALEVDNPNVEISLNARSDSQVAIKVTPSENHNPNFSAFVLDPSVVNAEVSGKSVALTALKEGKTQVIVQSAQPAGVAPAVINVAVTQTSTSIDSAAAAAAVRSVEWFDLSGRRLANPSGACIERTVMTDGSVTIRKVIK